MFFDHDDLKNLNVMFQILKRCMWFIIVDNLLVCDQIYSEAKWSFWRVSKVTDPEMDPQWPANGTIPMQRQTSGDTKLEILSKWDCSQLKRIRPVTSP